MHSGIRPNILHLFTDQQRFDTIAAHNNPYIKTPNLDRLVREGVSFQRAYTPAPECVPARGCMITGHYPGRTGCYSNAEAMPPESEGSFMQRLSAAGYRTHGIGKCHFTRETHALRGFQTRESQEELPALREEDDYARQLVEKGYGGVLEPHGVRGEMYYVPQVNLLPESEHPTHWIGERSVAFIEGQAEASEPWYLYGGFIHPHPPFAPPVLWHKLYRGPDMPLPEIPENLDELLCYINKVQNRNKYRDFGGPDMNLIRQMRAYYYACISFIDKQVGRILDALERTGQLDNTLILFAADHGEYLGDYNCFGKRGMHNASAQVPMIVRWPDASFAGARPNAPVSLVDLAPTFLQAAGVEFTEGEYDGLSLRDVADGTASRDCVFAQYRQKENALYMVVEQDWKYIFSAPDQKEFLFNMASDPKEHTNLSGNTAHCGHLERLRHKCQEWVLGTGQTEVLDEEGRWTAYPIKTLPQNPNALLNYQDPRWWDGTLPSW